MPGQVGRRRCLVGRGEGHRPGPARLVRLLESHRPALGEDPGERARIVGLVVRRRGAGGPPAPGCVSRRRRRCGRPSAARLVDPQRDGPIAETARHARSPGSSATEGRGRRPSGPLLRQGARPRTVRHVGSRRSMPTRLRADVQAVRRDAIGRSEHAPQRGRDDQAALGSLRPRSPTTSRHPGPRGAAPSRRRARAGRQLAEPGVARDVGRLRRPDLQAAGTRRAGRWSR